MINNQITQMGCGGVIGPSKTKGTSSPMEGKFRRTMLPLLWFKCPPSSKRLNNKEFNHVCSIDFIYSMYIFGSNPISHDMQIDQNVHMIIIYTRVCE
jgi:hypothetical protein